MITVYIHYQTQIEVYDATGIMHLPMQLQFHITNLRVAGAGKEWALQGVAGRFWSPPLVGMVRGDSPVRLEMAHQWAWYQRFCSLQPPAFLRIR